MAHTAFLSSSPLSLFTKSPLLLTQKCPSHMCAEPNNNDSNITNKSKDNNPSAPRKLPVKNAPAVPGRKLVRNKPGTSSTNSSSFADARPGDMVGGPPVGDGMGPRRGTKEKKVTRAAAIQKSQTFADAWAEQNQGRVDVWLIIGAITLLTPLIILAWAVATGVIPTGGLFEE